MTAIRKKRPALNEALRLARIYWGLNQKQMAQLSGLPRSTVSEIENANRNVSLDILQRYADALGLKASTLLVFTEKLEDEVSRSGTREFVARSAIKILNLLAPHEKK